MIQLLMTQRARGLEDWLPRHAFARHRARQHVAADDDAIDARETDVLEHGVERGQVAVDVVERGDAHERRHRSRTSE